MLDLPKADVYTLWPTLRKLTRELGVDAATSRTLGIDKISLPEYPKGADGATADSASATATPTGAASSGRGGRFSFAQVEGEDSEEMATLEARKEKDASLRALQEIVKTLQDHHHLRRLLEEYELCASYMREVGNEEVHRSKVGGARSSRLMLRPCRWGFPYAMRLESTGRRPFDFQRMNVRHDRGSCVRYRWNASQHARGRRGCDLGGCSEGCSRRAGSMCGWTSVVSQILDSLVALPPSDMGAMVERMNDHAVTMEEMRNAAIERQAQLLARCEVALTAVEQPDLLDEIRTGVSGASGLDEEGLQRLEQRTIKAEAWKEVGFATARLAALSDEAHTFCILRVVSTDWLRVGRAFRDAAGGSEDGGPLTGCGDEASDPSGEGLQSEKGDQNGGEGEEDFPAAAPRPAGAGVRLRGRNRAETEKVQEAKAAGRGGSGGGSSGRRHRR
jgi:hypothetical protein